MNSEREVLRTQDSSSEISKVKHKEQLNAIVKSVAF